MDAGDDGARHRRDHDRREGVKRVVADHHLQGEEHPGDRGVERGRDGARDAAPQQRQGQGRTEFQSLRDERRGGGPEMDDGTFPPGARARAEAGDGHGGHGQTLSRGQTPAAKRSRLDDLRDAFRRAAGDQELEEQADDKAARGGGEKNVSPGEVIGQRGDLLRREAVENLLYPAEQQTKSDRTVPDRHANDRRERRKNDLIVADEASPPRRHDIETWRSERHRPTSASVGVSVIRRLSSHYSIDCISQLYAIRQDIGFKRETSIIHGKGVARSRRRFPMSGSPLLSPFSRGEEYEWTPVTGSPRPIFMRYSRRLDGFHRETGCS